MVFPPHGNTSPESITPASPLHNSGSSLLQHPHSSQPSLAWCHHPSVCVLGAPWPDSNYDLKTRADSEIHPEHGRKGEANPGAPKRSRSCFVWLCTAPKATEGTLINIELGCKLPVCFGLGSRGVNMVTQDLVKHNMCLPYRIFSVLQLIYLQ